MDKDDHKTRTSVRIQGQTYKVVSEEDADHVKEVAKYIDDKMLELKRRNPYLDTTKLSVLTALNIADDYLKLKKESKGD